MNEPNEPDDVKAPENMVGAMMDYLVRRMRAEADGDLRTYGMKTRHAIALTLLRDFGERAQSELPAALGIDATGVVALLNDLESEGLVERRRSPEDRRRHNVLITTAGRRRLAEIEQVTSQLEQRILGLSSKELATLHKLLNKAMANAAGSDATAAKADVLVTK
ncbi:MarR family winged helix-turn-helix transcriptional regulator [Mycolicibacterium sp. BiH015]|uniref:MarR family winged helix-turn-helix transcriptional regulator n=1 Tax=Mycolicibacterium sp. BiH015 TaxID=3018808 RepID=UPI0022E8FEE5|nr:MarR family winged helix-turn-helix transcriptional regulator [Mycolicibacterium sp. BiH015]MDA2892202.1 MarR family winged helix-turn-helix transcriptional regulator [Mycolicibacterium sp. BiH015]